RSISPLLSDGERLPRREAAFQQREGLVGIIIGELPALSPGLEPRGETRLDRSGRRLLPLGCRHGEIVGVLVLRVPAMTPDPGPLNVVQSGRPDQCLPQLEVLDLAALPLPAARHPRWRPLAGALAQVIAM